MNIFMLSTLNCDGSSRSRDCKCGGGYYFKDRSNRPVCWCYVFFLGDNALSTEGQAVFHALLTVHTKNELR